MKQFLIKIIVSAVVIAFLVLCFHMEATYTVKAKVHSVEGNKVTFEDINTHDKFSCYTKEDHPNLRKGEKFIIKLDHKGTEADRTDDGLIDFGKHCICRIMW